MFLFASLTTLLALGQTTEVVTPAGGLDSHRPVFVGTSPQDPSTFLRPQTGRGAGWYLGAVAEYSSQPATIIEPDLSEVAFVSSMSVLNLNAGYRPTPSLLVSAIAPVFLSYKAPGEALGPTLGDLRLDGVYSFLMPAEEGTGLAVNLSVNVPTGDSSHFLGAPGLGVGALLLLSHEWSTITVSGAGGLRLASTTGVTVPLVPNGDAFEMSSGLGMMMSETLGLNLQATVLVPVDYRVREIVKTGSEVFLDVAKLQSSGASFRVGVGVGLNNTNARPFRLVVGGGFAKPKHLQIDSDEDGVFDSVDACPEEAEVFNGVHDEDGCPDAFPTMNVFLMYKDQPQKQTEFMIGQREEKTLARGRALIKGTPNEQIHLSARSSCLVADEEVHLSQDRNTRIELVLRRLVGELRVKVIDASQEVVSGVEVSLFTEDERCSENSKAELVSGTYELGVGEHTVVVTAPGFAQITRDVVVKAEHPTELVIVLDEE